MSRKQPGFLPKDDSQTLYFCKPNNERFPEELETLQEIDEIITLIKNGQWHTIEDLISKARLSKSETKEILKFLADYSFIHLDNENTKAKITSSLRKFLTTNEAPKAPSSL